MELFAATKSSESGRHCSVLSWASLWFEKGASDTLGLKAKAGRASYVDANELKHPDPGAHAVGIIMRALYQVCSLAGGRRILEF